VRRPFGRVRRLRVQGGRRERLHSSHSGSRQVPEHHQDTKKVANWIAKIKIEVKRQTAEIAALDSEGKPIATWNLEGVFPVKWTGPSLDIGANQVATETLELAHNGFLT